MTDQPTPEMHDASDEGYPVPPTEEELRDSVDRPDQRLPAYAAVFAYIAQLPTEMAYLNAVARNAMIWRAVHAALDATPVGRCISSHCVEGDHIIDLDAPTPPQDGPHAPQGGPQRPDAGAETADGAGGRQTGAEGREALRKRIEAAVRGCAEEGNIRYGHVADTVLAALAEHLDIADVDAWCKTCRRVWDGPRHRCESDAEQQAAGLRAAHIRDQAALAQIRLHIAVHRPRLKLADPVLLGKLDKVLREVGELEAADGGPSIAEAADDDRRWALEKEGS